MDFIQDFLSNTLSPYILSGIISVGFDVTDQLLIRFFTFVRYWREKLEYNEAVHQDN
jgi:hypothetical protein